MSLASLLLGKAAKASDAALDAIFSRTKVVPPSEKPSVIVEVSREEWAMDALHSILTDTLLPTPRHLHLKHL